MSEETQVVEVEQGPIVIQQKYKIYVVDNTSRMHTIRIGNGVELAVWDSNDFAKFGFVSTEQPAPQFITHENALSFYNLFMELILGDKVFSFRNEQSVMIYKTKNLVGLQIVPEEY
jgi:hypothetical protein